ncbi:major facilitator superfamily domain-containing protein [Exophiala viscosa]|uniref:major facilitator superfamily domain-containing protein n=1 Tax=Exophiala viscosa TaxID=2486360 RepID=UPI002197E1D4|nr:major facilitator superfamily domain-containing protein [Exophiala viscosa]
MASPDDELAQNASSVVNTTSDAERVDDGPSPSQEQSPEDETEYPSGMAVVLIMASVWLAFFLVALDRTILATAIPRITDQFSSLDDVGWYASAYMLTGCSAQLLYGRIYKFYSTKWVFLASVSLSELGSLVCGTAPNSIALIIGRAIAGIGAAGIFSGGMMVMIHTVPLHKRPVYAGIFGATFGIASVVGPLLGGAFTQKLTWRWCFYINLPIGGVAIAVATIMMKLPGQKDKLSLKQQFAQLDPLGTIVFLPSIVCLLLALQWGGTTYAWSSARIIALLVVFSVTVVAFAAIQIWKKDAAMVPPHILTQRTIASGAWFTLTCTASMTLMVYFLPIWFQAVKGSSALHSGIQLLPLVLSVLVASIIAGKLTQRIGYYVPAMFFASIVAPIGAGMLTTLRPDSNHSTWIGYQVLYGLGLGASVQAALIAAQAALPKSDVAIGTAIINFSQQFGGALFVSVGENLFLNNLASGLKSLPGLDVTKIVNTGATELRDAVPAQYLPQVLSAYNHALMKTMTVAAAMSALSILGTACIEWRNIKKSKKDQKGDKQPTEMPSSTPVEKTENDASNV